MAGALTVVVEGVIQVVLQALPGPLALHRSLAGEAHEGNHGQAAVPDLTLPEVVIGQEAQGVKGHLVEQARLQYTSPI